MAGSRRFQAPALVSASGRVYFPQPNLGQIRVIRGIVITQSLQVDLTNTALQVSNMNDGAVFAAGGGTNNALAIGNFQLVQPIQWLPGEAMWADITLATSIPGPTLDHKEGAKAQAGSAQPMQMTVVSPVPVGETVVGWAGLYTSGDTGTSTPTFGDSPFPANNYNNGAIVFAPISGTPGVRVSAALVSTALKTTDYFYCNNGNFTVQEAIGAASFLGVTGAIYATNTNTGTGTAASVATGASVNAGDLVVAAVSYESGTALSGQPLGWLELTPATSGAFTLDAGYMVPSTAGVVTYAPTLPASVAWAAAIIAISRIVPAPTLGLALVGQEYDT